MWWSSRTPNLQIAEQGAALTDDGDGADAAATADKDPFASEPKVTDPVCLILFLAYLGGMGWVSHYAVQHGDPTKLVAGLDYAGNMCGIDDMRDKPFLYWCPYPDSEVVNGVPAALNMDQPICVEACPRDSSLTTMCPKPAVVSVQKTDTQVVQTFTSVRTKLPTYMTTPVGAMYCLPNLTAMGMEKAEFVRSQLVEGDPFANPYVQLDEVMGGLARESHLFIGVVALGIGLSWSYLYLLSRIAKELVYGSLAVIILSLLLVGALFFLSAYDVWGLQDRNPIFASASAEGAFKYSNIIGGAVLLLAVLILVILCCVRDSMDEIMGCIEAACEALTELPTLWVQPILAAILKGIVFALLVAGGVYLMSLGEIVSTSITVGGSKISGLGRSMEYSEDSWRMLVFYVFGCVWVLEVCNGIQTFVVAFAVVQWFAMPMPKDQIVWFPVVRGFIRCMTFHLGSVACGAFLIATTRVATLILWIVSKQADQQGNAIGACLAKTCMACVECFRKCLEYINKNAYVDIAIAPNDFFFAAKKSCLFMKERAFDIAILDGACWFGQFSGILLVTGAGYGCTYLAVTNVERWANAESEEYIGDPLVVSIVAGVICCTISSMFLILFDDVSDTMLYCYAIAREKGVVSRYCPDALRQLTGQHETLKPKSEAIEDAEPLLEEPAKGWFW